MSLSSNTNFARRAANSSAMSDCDWAASDSPCSVPGATRRLPRRELPGAGASAPPGLPHFAPKAKSLIYLHMNGAPSQLDLWDYKPNLQAQFDKDLPDSIRMGQRITTMTSGQARLPVAPSMFKFSQHGSRNVGQ